MQFGLALHNYLSTNQVFPPQAIRNPDGKSLLSWRVAILPYLEEGVVRQAYTNNFTWMSLGIASTTLRWSQRCPQCSRIPGARPAKAKRAT